MSYVIHVEYVHSTGELDNGNGENFGHTHTVFQPRVQNGDQKRKIRLINTSLYPHKVQA